MTRRDWLAARAYARVHDALVESFPPYQDLLDTVVAYVERAAILGYGARGGKRKEGVRVLDIACGTGTLARRLASAGFTVLAGDGVPKLVEVARARPSGQFPRPIYLIDDPIQRPPKKVDIVVSLNTYYWHPVPALLLHAARTSLDVGGHAVFVTYMLPAGPLERFRFIRLYRGSRAALGALRWLLLTAAFEALRTDRRRYVSNAMEFEGIVRAAGFEPLHTRQVFLDLCALVWARRSER